MNVGVIILTWNARDAALACRASLAQQTHQPQHILVVDNASADDTVVRIRREYPDTWLIENKHNLGFAGGMNVGITALQALPEPPEIVVLLNQDTVLTPSWLREITAPFVDPEVGAVGCKILYPDGTIQHAGKFLEWPRAVAQHVGWHERDLGQYDQPQTVEDVTAAAIALRMDALRSVGLLDPGYAPAYYEDSDLCWRLRRRSYSIVYAPNARLTHHESLSISDEVRRSQLYNRGRLRFVLKSYTLTDILGPFAESEREFIAEHGRGAEARALRWAYIETLVQLPGILQARAEFHPALSGDESAALAQLLLDLKRALAQALYQRGIAAIETISSL